jgi:hypothetical protein
MAVGFGVVVGVRQLGYLEFLELGRAANRTLNLRRVIANDINIRHATDALRSCTTLPQFCRIMRQCLKPAGFDGFGLYLSSELPLEDGASRPPRSNRSKVRFFWDRSLISSETDWSMSFSLTKQDSERLGSFILYRKERDSALLVDTEIFTATGFCSAVASVIEKMQSSWFVGSQSQMPGMLVSEKNSSVIAGSIRGSMAIPSST